VARIASRAQEYDSAERELPAAAKRLEATNTALVEEIERRREAELHLLDIIVSVQVSE
jgi:hypothetical protein